MKRDIIKIDEEKCTGCGVCVPNCHEGALKIINGKAKLVSEVLCDGLGACLGHCPEGAITIEKCEAEPFKEASPVHSCPGSSERELEAHETSYAIEEIPSELRHWPVQMHLINPSAPYFKNTDLLMAADCVAFSLGSFHNKFLKKHSLSIACPKLDSGSDVYIEKLVALIDIAKVNTITVMIMEVPCCGGLLKMVRTASEKASRKVPVKLIIVSIDGKILRDEWI